MRLHRLVLTNYRGIAHREIEFPDRGVTVVSGPNEVGKSSLIEALDLLLESKDRSAKKDVKQIKPTHADVGSEVTAEISTGRYRFVYRKRFHKKCETELTIIAPQREQITGDEAHDRVRSMLAETVDTGLWQAQRVLQAASTAAVDLSGCDALSRALDIAAGDADDLAGLSGSEPLLIERIDTEFGRYFTATGRPTGEWAAVRAAVDAAAAGVAECETAVAEVDARVRRHAELAAELAELENGRAALTARLAAAEAADTAITALADELRTEENAAAAAVATSAHAAAAHKDRLRLRAEVNTRAEEVLVTDTAAGQAAEAAESGVQVLAEAERLAADAAAVLQQGLSRAETARRALAELAAREEADRLAPRLAAIDTAESALNQVAVRLRDIPLTEKAFRAIEEASADVGLAEAKAALSAPQVRFTAESGVDLLIGGRRITLAAGQSHTVTVADDTEIALPGVGSLSVVPGDDTHARLVAARRQLAEALAGPGVADLAEARQLDATRRELLSQRDHLTGTLTGLLGGDSAAALRDRLETLRAELTDGDPVDPTAVRSEAAAAEAAWGLAAEADETQRKLVVAAAKQDTERRLAATALREKAAAARREHAAAVDRLAAQHAEISDDDLAVRAQASADEAQCIAARVDAVRARMAQADPPTVAAELSAARADVTDFTRQHGGIERDLHDIEVELTVIGTQGRRGRLDAARVRHEHAVTEHDRVRRRADAARTLRDVMGRHRDTTRQRYVQPFRDELERLGRIVFGPTFEVEIDSDLQIRNRTLDGRTVPFESLSGGAREQLGILARLAVAALVDTQDAVPVMIDDALGFSDPDRLARMGAVFDTVGADGQVIVLTCAADRYRGVSTAHTVELSVS